MLPKLAPGTPEIWLGTRSYLDRTVGYITVRQYGTQIYRCCSLELPWRNNENDASCFPEGDYEIRLEFSPAFGKELWELKGVPGRGECKIHGANHVSQLRGCVAPGTSFADLNKDGIIDVANSGIALKEFHAAMGDAKVSYIHVSSILGSRVLGPGMNGYK